ncbi:MAG: hypothetical protein RID59_11530 [Hoeflea sp.]
MTLVSELVLTRNQLLQIMRSHDETPFAAPLQRLNQVTTELQESVMISSSPTSRDRKAAASSASSSARSCCVQPLSVRQLNTSATSIPGVFSSATSNPLASANCSFSISGLRTAQSPDFAMKPAQASSQAVSMPEAPPARSKREPCFPCFAGAVFAGAA